MARPCYFGCLPSHFWYDDVCFCVPFGMIQHCDCQGEVICLTIFVILGCGSAYLVVSQYIYAYCGPRSKMDVSSTCYQSVSTDYRSSANRVPARSVISMATEHHWQIAQQKLFIQNAFSMKAVLISRVHQNDGWNARGVGRHVIGATDVHHVTVASANMWTWL